MLKKALKNYHGSALNVQHIKSSKAPSYPIAHWVKKPCLAELLLRNGQLRTK